VIASRLVAYSLLYFFPRLKDSDVTWLYGPLHTAVDWEPLPYPKSESPTVDKQPSPQDRSGLNSASDQPSQLRSKPILKHRSISDLLTSALPNLGHTDDDVENDPEPVEDEDDEIHSPPARPPLLHTKSDSNVMRWSRNRPFRKDSPPRIIAPTRQPRPSEATNPVAAPPLDERSASSDSARDTTSSSQDLSVSPTGGKRRHITFNTFVEQCIAIDSPPKPRRGSLPGESHSLHSDSYDDGSVPRQLHFERANCLFVCCGSIATMRTRRLGSMTLTTSTRVDYSLKVIMAPTRMRRAKCSRCALHRSAHGPHPRHAHPTPLGTPVMPIPRSHIPMHLLSTTRHPPIKST
jgi:hypothetical protein